MCTNDLEGIVAKRLADPYEPRIRWLKIKNPDYTQKEGQGELCWSAQGYRRRSASSMLTSRATVMARKNGPMTDSRLARLRANGSTGTISP
jgi:ATP-dependent DNA ligase